MKRIRIIFLYVGRKCKRRKSARVTRRVHASRCIVSRNWVIVCRVGGCTHTKEVGFTSIYPAVNNFFPRSPSRRLRSRVIQSNRSESARFRLLMRTHVASCAREMRKDIGGGMALKMRKELLPRERKREGYYMILYEITC